MTIPSSPRKAGPLLGTGLQTVWPFAFKVFAATDVAVTIADYQGRETLLVLNTDYSVALNVNQETSPGGTITYPISGDPLPPSSVLTITGDIDYEQSYDIPTGGNFSPTVLENELDRIVMQVQQLKEEIDRSAKLPVTSSEDANALVADLVRLADSADNIDAIVANLTSVTAVGNDLRESVSEINTVAVYIDSVNNVGNNIDNVNTVAGIRANVISVTSNASNINTAATNMAAIIAAPTQASAAAASATAASASAAAAAATLASGMYSAVQDKSADYTVVAADAGDLIRVDTSGGARTITLPAISTQADGFKIAVVKWSGDASAVTVARSSANLINGSTSYVLDAQYKSATFVADFETNTWFAAGAGGGGSNITIDPFTGNGSTTAFTLSGDPGSENNTLINVAGAFQLRSTYSLSGAVVTFNSAPPNGAAIEVQWSQPLSIGVPSDASVSTVKLGDAAVTTAKIVDGAVTTEKVAINSITPAKLDRAYLPLGGGTLTGALVGTMLSDAGGDVRSIPQNAKTASYTLLATDNGKHISITTGGVTVPASVFSVGQVVTIFNNSASAQTITQGASVTMYNSGGGGSTGNRTLGARGIATVLCVAADTFTITGAGLT